MTIQQGGVMKYKSILSIAAVAMIWPVAATAAPPQLKGNYAVTGTVFCLQSNLPFNANLTPAPGSIVGAARVTVVGTETFNGNGTGQMTLRSVGLNVPPNPPALGGSQAGSSDATATLKYSFDASGGVSINIVPGTLVVTNLTGPGAGSSFTVDTEPLYGMVSNDNKMIVLATVDAVMETQTITPVGGGTVIHYRFCNRSYVLTWIGNLNNNNNNNNNDNNNNNNNNNR